jgi:hypothetical protein
MLVMAKYIIGYDLRKDKNYKKLTDELERIGAFRILLSDWCLVKADTSCQAIRDYLLDYIDADDRLIVTKVAVIDEGATWNAITPL